MDNNTTLIILVIVVLAIVGALLALYFTFRTRTKDLKDQFGKEYDHTVNAMGGVKKAHTELQERQKHVESLDIRPLTKAEHDRYLAEWMTVQSRFVDEPRRAIVAADQLIMEVMRTRAYPISDFEQRAADISVSYPSLINNYRAARAIALKNNEGKADTEELRQAMIYYRSLFDELLSEESILTSDKEVVAA